jgi:hypothetical protein
MSLLRQKSRILATDALSAINTLYGWSGNGCLCCVKSHAFWQRMRYRLSIHSTVGVVTDVSVASKVTHSGNGCVIGYQYTLRLEW